MGWSLLVTAGLAAFGCKPAPAPVDTDRSADVLDDTGPTGPFDADRDGWEELADCDDDDPLVHPGAVEDCRTAADDDCVRGNESICYDALAEHLSVSPTDACCAGMVFLDDVDGDGVRDAAIGAGLADTVGAVWIASGSEMASGSEFPTPFGRVVGSADDYGIGGAAWYEDSDLVANAGDVDGDGLDDLLLGGRPSCGDGGCSYPRRAYVVSASRLVAEVPISASDAILEGDDDWFGWHVAGAGDLDGDGLAEVSVAGGYDTLLFSGAGLRDGQLLGRADARSVLSRGATVRDTGDVDGDGLADVLLSASAGERAGGVWLADGTELAAGETSVDALPRGLIVDEETSDGFATRAYLADLDGDGLDEVVAATWQEARSAGAVYVLPASALAGPGVPRRLAHLVILGAYDPDAAGAALAAEDGALVVTGFGAPDGGEEGRARRGACGRRCVGADRSDALLPGLRGAARVVVRVRARDRGRRRRRRSGPRRALAGGGRGSDGPGAARGVHELSLTGALAAESRRPLVGSRHVGQHQALVRGERDARARAPEDAGDPLDPAGRQPLGRAHPRRPPGHGDHALDVPGPEVRRERRVLRR
jgi:hypothetical protein